MDDRLRAPRDPSLDPEDWDTIRRQGHRMLDAMFDYVEHVRDRPVWRPIPPAIRASFREPLPARGTDLDDVYRQFTERILPFATGNVHPGFMGWVHGGGSVVGMLAEMLAAALNANLGGRDHVPIEVERQVVEWVREMLGFPAGASGLFVTGTSIANFLGLVVARTSVAGARVRADGVTAIAEPLVAYTSTAAHSCIRQAFELSGIGGKALRTIATDYLGRIDVDALRVAIAADRAAGAKPFMLIGTAGTVNIGALDDLERLADLARDERLWLHVDGAFGALGMLAPDIAPRLRGIERADSVAFDFHKWGQAPYDAGFLIVRDGGLHRAAFASSADYLRRETRGLAAGSPWPSEFGPDLSRGFRALKVWFMLKTYGADRIGAAISRTCEVARHLEQRVCSESKLELLAPAQLNIVCFRYRCGEADRVNAHIVADLHESGIAAPSTTTVQGKLAIRAAIVNHRTQTRDVDALVDATLAIGDAVAAGRSPSTKGSSA
jgi:glutamate/tyrosine decarboxylase-like PLP-dependent enzyme